ncbi:DUF2924 domain-containing protein [Maricaulis sp.]|jgi:DUF2924 family protein|uniref:DUF2924 domain-containing protein n=1 Tax=Maricaulis sp. TaxID=1486257 RepID=UPI0026386482|nr:DUF2924 domain-containing protein [Maricaulis sp.]MDF1767893.1 DUF2924 domain-containing protein [Maricaulis sp.]
MARRNRKIVVDLEGLLDKSRDELVAIWMASFASNPPRGLSQAFLARLVAYDLQADARGGISPRLEKRLLSMAAGETPKPTAPKLKPGAQLMRTWNGVTHRVDVVEEGYRYKKETYASLSAIAKMITGTHWSGPRFFGLITRKKAA